jgi:hypothetical protein
LLSRKKLKEEIITFLSGLKKNVPFRKLWCLGMITFLFPFFPAAPVRAEAQAEQKLTLDMTVNQNWVSGPGASQSWLATGHPFVSNIVSYNYNRTDQERKFAFGFQGRITDDETVDLQTCSLSNLTLNWEDQARKIYVGDVMANFSNYSMCSALKGFSYNILPSNGPSRKPEINFLYGVGYPRWDNFWGGTKLKAIKRTAAGLNIRESFGEKGDLGLTFVNSDDTNRLFSTDPLYQNNVYTLNWELRPKEGLNLKGESACSTTTQSPSDSESDRDYHGYAHQFSLNKTVRHQKWLYEYEIVSPDFTSLLGYAITDQERMKLRWTHNLSPDLSLDTGVAWSHNGLTGSTQTYRTDLYQPEFNLSLITPFRRETANLDLGIRFDRRYGGGSSESDRTVMAAYRDTFGKVETDISLDYQFDKTTPYDSGVKNDNLAFNLTLAANMDKTSYILRPMLTLNCSRNMDLLNHYNDRMYEAAAGLSYQRPQGDFNCNFRVGKNQNLKESTPDSSKWFSTFREEAQPDFLKKYNARQFLEIGINAYKFDDAGNKYRETGASAGIHFEF